MNEIWGGVLANFITVILTLIAAWTFYAFFGRRGLLRFFGTDDVKILRIYIGHIMNPNGAEGFVGFEEISDAKNIEALFKSVIPGLGDQPGLLKFLQVGDIQTEIIPGRVNSPDVNLAYSFVSLGSSESNFAAALLENEMRNPVRFNRDNRTIEVPSLQPIANDQAVVVRICSGNKSYFCIEGTTESTTAGAARFLIREWKSMRKIYGDRKSFYYIVQVKNDSCKSVISVANNELKIEN